MASKELNKKRLQNFRKILEKYENKQDLAKDVGCTPSYISHILSGKRNLGNLLCKRIEKSLSLKQGWLDQ